MSLPQDSGQITHLEDLHGCLEYVPKVTSYKENAPQTLNKQIKATKLWSRVMEFVT
jgi:hypothetical protein